MITRKRCAVMCCKKIGKFDIDGERYCKEHAPHEFNFRNVFKRFLWNGNKKEVEYTLKNGRKVRYLDGD